MLYVQQKAGKTYNLIKALLGRTGQEDQKREFAFMEPSLEYKANSNFEKQAKVFNLGTTFLEAKNIFSLFFSVVTVIYFILPK